MTQTTEPSPKQLPLWASLLVVLVSLAAIGGSAWWYLRDAARSPAVAIGGPGAAPSPRQVKMNELWTLIEKGDLPGVKKAIEADSWLATVKNPAISNATPLHSAGWHGNADIANFFLDKGADPNAIENEYNGTPLSWSIVAGQKATVAVMLKRGARNTPDMLGTAEAGKRGDFKDFAPNPPAAYDAIIALLKEKGN